MMLMSLLAWRVVFEHSIRLVSLLALGGGGLRAVDLLAVEAVEAYVPGFAFLVVLHNERLLLVVLDEGLLLAHVLDGCVGQ